MKDEKIKAVSAETRKAVEPIYIEFYEQVFNYAKYVVKNHEDAEDVTVDVFAKIMNLYGKPETRFNPKRTGKNGKPAALRSWVRTVTNSVIIDFFRTNHQDRFTPVSDFLDADGNDNYKVTSTHTRNPEKIAVNNELRISLDKAFRGLKLKYRRIASLYFEKEQSYEEIADELNVPMGTVKGMISRARQKLQSELQGLYDTQEAGAVTDVRF